MTTNREGAMTSTDLAHRIVSALHRYTAETALRLENTDALFVSINPDDWDDVRRSVSIEWMVPVEGNRFMDMRVAVDPATERGKPRLVSHWEIVL